jgi:hypothetical protein
MEDSKICPPCLIGRIVVLGLALWGAWAAYQHFFG